MSRTWFCLPLTLIFGCAHHADERKDAPAAPPPAAAEPTRAPAQATKTDSSGDRSGVLGDCGPVKIHFPFNSSEMDRSDMSALERSAQCLKEDRALHVTIEGNADERGTDEYNLALGDRRANTVAKYLEALGVSSSQLKTVSYGKENPICSEHDEACWAQNRRAAVKPSVASTKH